ncbi:ribose import ATP-binding protein [Dinoroseobacter shibae DFL 12 = DSM 16493]|uniref:Ribose import ATP-binding protein n=1 Tax=Dinoroseobacter shibae (strain DSM 16493 / NCIMB 14021 / DFL 12) TaxID=398580 RepID=A8LS74_DINSH|nr:MULTISPECIES: ATP-binding cassette domain-containing protein [Dinoroseobacter]ABV94167.1 ribose import ATP-binding protein [Dinoroseobacter shibae DFL 12 = DSM 16493]MDD9716317.1 sugar ABC transporter ATP-binding protein [Dinoroseobacter sp. PD6]URF45608.1 sugar ABC transporter ATP-binding protein [Dinoroseobacter shibae]URF49913.1 sugar ABC transporter ATP-binding protein [Dinoroseobacter shibae]
MLHQTQRPLPSEDPPVSQAALALAHITKTFPGVKALSDVSLSLYPGKVTALIGENGAGKSTVVKILTGIYQPDGGRILVDGQPVPFSTPQAAADHGVTAIHQETVLFDELSVAENIFLGHAPRGAFGLIDWKKTTENARALLTSIGAELDPDHKLKDLGIANKHLVAIARALSIEARVVIMDEPTAALSHKEIEELYELVESLKAQGKAILFISHKFDEIFRIADNYTVFRDGQLIGDGAIADVTEADLVKMMVGRDVSQIFPQRAPNVGDTVLTVQGYAHPTEFDDISFTLREGEILGFYGLVGAGRSEFMQSLFGITRPSAGSVEIGGARAEISSPADAVDHGIVYVPEDRGKQGAILDLPIFQNVTLPSLGRISRKGFLRLAEEFALAREYTERLDLRAASLDTHVGNLSGGNQQKVVIAKWLATRPRVIILDEPTKGVDIGSKAAVHDFMAELAAQGLAVIMVSSEIPEVLGMSDRVIVMREGRIVAELAGDDLQPETLVRHAAGI